MWAAGADDRAAFCLRIAASRVGPVFLYLHGIFFSIKTCRWFTGGNGSSHDAPPRERGWVYSLDRLIEQGPDLLVAGHGCVLSNPLPLLREARKNWDPCLKAYDELNPHPSEEAFFSPFSEK